MAVGIPRGEPKRGSGHLRPALGSPVTGRRLLLKGLLLEFEIGLQAWVAFDALVTQPKGDDGNAYPGLR